MKTILTVAIAFLFSLTAYSQQACDDCFGDVKISGKSDVKEVNIESNAESSTEFSSYSSDRKRLHSYSNELKSKKRKQFKDTFVGGELRQIGYIAVLSITSVLIAVMLNHAHSTLVQ